jgi:hypothetical protein
MEWWVIPEGFAGQLVQGLSPGGPALHVYTVKQSATPPPGQVAGPYSTQAEAQAQATALNQGSTATPAHIAQASASSISSSILGPLFQSNIWLRVAEVLIGVVLIGIGLNAMLKGKPLQVVTSTAGMAAKVVP